MASRLRNKFIVLAVAAAVAVGAAVVLVLKPWQSVDIPDSACWGTLSRADLVPVAGADGKMIVDSPQSLTGLFHLQGLGMCEAQWNGSQSLFSAFVTPAAPEDIKTYAPQPSVETRWSPQVNAMSSPNGTLLYYACAYPSSTDSAVRKFEPYVKVFVSGATRFSSHGETVARQAYALMALKIAKAVARQLPCTNTINFPATAPAVPAVK